ncbi:MAG: hypothetical protein VX438_03170 [Planctomycetota bacterium]|nr:hypothetical protein [Planctomycetota bacterium]
MRISIFTFSLFTLLAVTIHCSQDSTTKPKPTSDWKKDPVCRAVFDAVLTGLQQDQVSQDIVTSIIGEKELRSTPKSIKRRLQTSFVVDCPLCEPTFHAFLTYQNGDRGKHTLTSSAGLTPDKQKQLLSDNTRVRLKALAPIVQKWVLTSLNQQKNITPQKISDWNQRIKLKAAQGKTKLVKLMKETQYQDWSPYWGCAACNGTEDAAAEWQREQSSRSDSAINR